MVIEIKRSIVNHIYFQVLINIFNHSLISMKEIILSFKMNLKAIDLLQLIILIVFRFLIIPITLEITFHFFTYLSKIIQVIKTTLRQLYFCHLSILHISIVNYFHLMVKQHMLVQWILGRAHSTEELKLLFKNQKSLKHLKSVFLVIILRILKHFQKKYCCLVSQHTNLVLIQVFYLKNDSQAFNSRNANFFLISLHFIRIYIFIAFYY